MKEVIGTITAEELFHLKKERYNSFQTGFGAVKSSRDKLRDRNSKISKSLKKELKSYCS